MSCHPDNFDDFKDVHSELAAYMPHYLRGETMWKLAAYMPHYLLGETMWKQELEILVKMSFPLVHRPNIGLQLLMQNETA